MIWNSLKTNPNYKLTDRYHSSLNFNQIKTLNLAEIAIIL
jgi:hypothetical protein